MRLIFSTIAVAAALASAAAAQTNPATQGTGSANPAVTNKRADSPGSTGPLEPGANSFTEGQARSRLEAQGLGNVTDLRKDEQGIWRGKATRNGRTVSVGIDYKGTVQAR
ncbi:MAG: PepSY domain-containing protein [Microvirga sp.]